ncbi:MAG: DUF1549 domain-containing protein [Planctomycetes bacterium]|nr:DUF1549 domain-containing protein [Planctomycetota bacterium]
MTPQLLGLAILFGQPAPADPSAFINQELAKSWQTEKLTPADNADDRTFQRRASLDLIGRIPTLEEQQAYLKDPDKHRRKLLIDRLLAHDDFPRHWGNIWTDWLLGAAGDRKARTAFHEWMAAHFARNGSHKELAESVLLVKGALYNNPAGHFLSVHRGQPIPAKEWEKLGQYDMFPATAKTFRIFHARRLECVQCHDHAFDDFFRQHHFHAANLFFRQVGFTRKRAPNNEFTEHISDDPQLNKSGLLPMERRNGIIAFTRPRFLDGDVWKPDMKQTRREFFTERLVKHPQFARAHVNFLWAHFFGHGLTQTADFDDMIADNPVVHPKVMDRLAAEFVKSGYDSRALMRWICNSDAYGRSSVANKTNAGADKVVYFSRMQTRPLTRPQLVESLVVVFTMENYVKRRDKLRTEFFAELPPLVRQEVNHCEVEPLNPRGELSIPQALWLNNGTVWQREASAPDSTIAKLLKKVGGPAQKNMPKFIEEIYPVVYCRSATPKEVNLLLRHAEQMVGRSPQKNTPQFWRNLCEDIFWAMTNSAEFSLQH